MWAMHWTYFVRLQRAIGRFHSRGIFAALTIRMAFISIQSEYRKKPAFYRYQMQAQSTQAPTLVSQRIVRAQRATQQILQSMVMDYGQMANATLYGCTRSNFNEQIV